MKVFGLGFEIKISVGKEMDVFFYVLFIYVFNKYLLFIYGISIV